MQAGQRLSWYPLFAASPGSKAVPPAGGWWRFVMSKNLSVFGGVFPSRPLNLTRYG